MALSTGVGRLFWAVPIDEQIRRALEKRLRADLAGKPPPGRVPRADGWHITLRFLGEVTQSQYDTLVKEWRVSPAGEGFDIAFRGLGAFPHPGKAAVLWMGIEDAEAGLSRLAARAEATAVAAGFEAERRAFHPHLTVSRIRPPKDLRELISRANAPAISMRVETVVLFRSHLGSDGARYEAVDRFPLG